MILAASDLTVWATGLLAPVSVAAVGALLTLHLRAQDRKIAETAALTSETHKAVNSRYDKLEERANASDAANLELRAQVALLVADKRVTALQTAAAAKDAATDAQAAIVAAGKVEP
ncbi:MAG TPA: hypothetical protein VKQ71_03630 [Acidimicrobiales bacterium]|nr:hypothetical protein [Acidimicrobiales bacterium]